MPSDLDRKLLSTRESVAKRDWPRPLVFANDVFDVLHVGQLLDKPTPCELIEQLKPDVDVKGGECDMATLRKTALMQQWDGRSVAIPFVAGYSTTRLVERIRSS